MSVNSSSVFLVVMGVAGCGKSSLGQSLAAALQLPLIEGDDHHSAASRDKMSRGVALTDADRADPPPMGSWVTYRYRGTHDGGLPRFASFVRVRLDMPVGTAPAAAPQ